MLGLIHGRNSRWRNGIPKQILEKLLMHIILDTTSLSTTYLPYLVVLTSRKLGEWKGHLTINNSKQNTNDGTLHSNSTTSSIQLLYIKVILMNQFGLAHYLDLEQGGFPTRNQLPSWHWSYVETFFPSNLLFKSYHFKQTSYYYHFYKQIIVHMTTPPT